MDSIFSADPVVRRFSVSGADKFEAALREADRRALFCPLHSPGDVLLDRTGHTAGGYRFTTLAFYQLCHALCPGIYRFLQELAGLHRHPDEPRSDFCVHEALDVFNRVVQRRFSSRLAGRQLLRNAGNHLIEGVVGSKYKWLSNLELFLRARETAVTAEFYEGVVAGRSMLLRLYRRDSKFSVGDDTYYLGYHFSNNEVGKGAVKTATFLLRSRGRTSSLGRFIPGSSLRHLGDTFGVKLTRLIHGALAVQEDVALCQTNLTRLTSVPLGLGLAVPEQEESRRQDLVHILTRHHMRVGLATRVVGSMLAQGSYEDERTPLTQVRLEVLASRNAFDLYNAIGREAKRVAIGPREHAEQVAHSLLVGRISIPSH